MKLQYESELYHFGIKGMRWGIRRFQNKDGTLTPEGVRRRYGRRKSEDDYKQKERLGKDKAVRKLATDLAEKHSIPTWDAYEKYSDLAVKLKETAERECSKEEAYRNLVRNRARSNTGEGIAKYEYKMDQYRENWLKRNCSEDVKTRDQLYSDAKKAQANFNAAFNKALNVLDPSNTLSEAERDNLRYALSLETWRVERKTIRERKKKKGN